MNIVQRQRVVLAAAVVAVVCAFLVIPAAAGLVGGWRDVDPNSAEALEVAKFSAKTISEMNDLDVPLLAHDVITARRQLVAGVNWEISFHVSVGNHVDETVYIARVFQDLQGKYHLKSFRTDVLAHAGIADVLTFSTTCRYFHQLVSENQLWQSLLCRDFGNSYLEESSQCSAKELYIRLHSRFEFNTVVHQPTNRQSGLAGVEYTDGNTVATCNNEDWNTIFGKKIWKEHTGIHSFTVFLSSCRMCLIGIVQVPPHFTVQGDQLVGIGDNDQCSPNETIHHYGKFEYADQHLIPTYNFGSNASIPVARLLVSPSGPATAVVLLPPPDSTHNPLTEPTEASSPQQQQQQQIHIGAAGIFTLVLNTDTQGSVTVFTNMETCPSLLDAIPDVVSRIEEYDRRVSGDDTSSTAAV